MPFSGLITILENLLGQFRAPQERSLLDLVRPVSMSFTAGARPEHFLLGSAIGGTFADPQGTGWGCHFAELSAGVRLENMTRIVATGGAPTVLRRLEFAPVELTDPAIAGGATVSLPLTAAHRIAHAAVGGVSFAQLDAHPYFRLATSIETAYVLVYGYIVATDGSIGPLAINDALAEDLAARILNGGLQNHDPASTVVLVTVEVVFCAPRRDFDPFAAGEAARCYPLVSVWSDKPVERFDCAIEFERPDQSAMMMAHGNREIHVSFYTDRNYDDELTLIDLAPLPQWDMLFDHYLVEGNGSGEHEAVNDRGHRVNTTSRVVRRWHNGYQDPVTTTYIDAHVETRVTPVVKVERQGKFDNVHLAPAMNNGGAKSFMAPICQHDCAHMHWRWSTGYSRNVQNLGWSPEWPGLGGPNRGKGTPMIPPNQTLRVVAIDGKAAIRYEASARHVDHGSRPRSQRWDVFCHHGLAYVTDFYLPVEWAGVPGEWTFAAYPGGVAGFYYDLRYFKDENGVPVSRVDESAFPDFEDM